VSFLDIRLDVSNEKQEDKIVAFLFKPMVLDAGFTLRNIKMSKYDQMRIMQLKFILDEFQGDISITNITFESLQWLEQHSFIEFSQSNRFMDKLYEAKSYKPAKNMFYTVNISDIYVLFCVFDASITLLTFPTTNVVGTIENIKIEKSTFASSTNLIASFSSIEPA
jgi:hypothetical protein